MFRVGVMRSIILTVEPEPLVRSSVCRERCIIARSVGNWWE